MVEIVAATAAPVWSPAQYLQFKSERLRPAVDLLRGVLPLLAGPRLIYDLGCGPGSTSTEILQQAYPAAELIGIDQSPEMLAAARLSLPQLRFDQADLTRWQPEEQPDLLFANATFQWVKDHVAVMQRLLSELPTGGVLAVQMPDNRAEPSHALMADVALELGGHMAVDRAASTRENLLSIAGYYEALRDLAGSLQLWQTRYVHELENVKALIEFVSATGLKPYVQLLSPDEKAEYLARYEEKLALAYPAQRNGKLLFYFPRIFIVAQRK